VNTTRTKSHWVDENFRKGARGGAKYEGLKIAELGDLWQPPSSLYPVAPRNRDLTHALVQRVLDGRLRRKH
jgi:hypothetical protein